MAKRRYPLTGLYHLLAAYADVLNRQAEKQRAEELWPFKLPPQTVGGRDA
jgi:hypothetical protein